MEVISVRGLIAGGAAEDKAKEICLAILQFYQKNGLLAAARFKGMTVIEPGFVLSLEDMMPLGQEIARDAVQRYLKRFERNSGVDPFDIRIISRALGSLRALKKWK